MSLCLFPPRPMSRRGDGETVSTARVTLHPPPLPTLASLPSSTGPPQVIEAADLQLGCDLTQGEQWWPLGIVRSQNWSASPGWEQMPVGRTPFVGGAAGGQPHVGCSIQYNSMHLDPRSGVTYFAYWDVSFNPANKSTPPQSWNEYALAWGYSANDFDIAFLLRFSCSFPPAPSSRCPNPVIRIPIAIAGWLGTV